MFVLKFRDTHPTMIREEFDQLIAALQAFREEYDSHLDEIGEGGGAEPGGADTMVQYNDAGVFGGDVAFTFNKTTRVVRYLGQYYSQAVNDGASGSALTLDFNTGTEHSFTLTANCTLSMVNAQNGGRYTLMITQDGTGGRTMTWPSNVRWNGGPAPTLTATANRTDLVVFMYLSVEDKYVAAYNLNYDLT